MGLIMFMNLLLENVNLSLVPKMVQILNSACLMCCLDYVCEDHNNPPDFFLDVLSGCIPPSVPLTTKERVDNGKEPNNDGNCLKTNGTQQLSLSLSTCSFLLTFIVNKVLDFSFYASTDGVCVSYLRSCKMLSMWDCFKMYLNLSSRTSQQVLLNLCLAVMIATVSERPWHI